jgi:aerobic C4-dicarboxylate transport protein
VINILKPGTGMNVDPATLNANAVSSYVTQSNTTGVIDFFLHIIPDNIINALSPLP